MAASQIVFTLPNKGISSEAAKEEEGADEKEDVKKVERG